VVVALVEVVVVVVVVVDGAHSGAQSVQKKVSMHLFGLPPRLLQNCMQFVRISAHVSP
jgi:hypothetical protein